MRALLITVTAGFALLTAAIVAHTGLIGFYQQLAASPAAWQTLVDIAIALGLVLVWMHQDARRSGRAFWPWVPVTLLLGSFGPLLYLLHLLNLPVLPCRAKPRRSLVVRNCSATSCFTHSTSIAFGRCTQPCG